MSQPDHIPTADELGAVLAPKHRQFADIFLTNGLNAAAAARSLKYKNHTEGPRLRERPDVKAYINARLEENQVSKAHITARLQYFAAGDMADFARVAPSERSYWVRADQHEEVREYAKRRGILPRDMDAGDLAGIVGGENVAQTEEGVLIVCIRAVEAEITLDWRAVEDAYALGRIKKLELGKDGSVKFELYDAMRATELLGKTQKMFVEKHEHSGRVGMVVGIDIVPPEGAR